MTDSLDDVRRHMEKAVLEQHQRNLEVIETAAQRADQVGCGVVLHQHKDGTITAVLDPFAPPRTMNIVQD